MPKLKLKQVLSNLKYNAAANQLIISGSNTINTPDIILSGSMYISSSIAATGSLTIDGVNTFGDSGSFDTIDLGSY